MSKSFFDRIFSVAFHQSNGLQTGFCELCGKAGFSEFFSCLPEVDSKCKEYHKYSMPSSFTKTKICFFHIMIFPFGYTFSYFLIGKSDSHRQISRFSKFLYLRSSFLKVKYCHKNIKISLNVGLPVFARHLLNL